MEDLNISFVENSSIFNKTDISFNVSVNKSQPVDIGTTTAVTTPFVSEIKQNKTTYKCKTCSFKTSSWNFSRHNLAVHKARKFTCDHV